MLNIFLILAVVILFQRQNRFIEMERNQRKIQQESEEMLSAFLLEIKEENKSFISKFYHTKQDDRSDEQPIDIDIHRSKDEPIRTLTQEEPITSETYSRMLASEVYQKSSDNKRDSEEKTFIEQVDALSQKGLTSSEIAKHLKKGKTEVELLLKFHENRK
ncbi:hypothetical protein KHA93_04850 [Bacillus sp. FJAT-49732]|uniref:Coupling factor for flagellin transcription and translation n=1 Tax=Lederbergia citrisecunda TaxID=2833583 RepID=A0A942TN28_9BACI|nr:hypothetical protein [Lederbergia citrisecunda]MBS4198982.1 hypothetical protein [Lederbergia citrisecunda]